MRIRPCLSGKTSTALDVMASTSPHASGWFLRNARRRSCVAAQDATGKSVRAGALHWSKTKRSPPASRRNADGRLTRPFSSIWNSYLPRKLVTPCHSVG